MPGSEAGCRVSEPPAEAHRRQPDNAQGGSFEEVVERLERGLRTFAVRELPLADNKAAAVALTLLPDDSGAASFLLTRRARGLRRHRGQWALPGGRVDEGETETEAARRELLEELGVSLPASSMMGALDDFVTRSGYRIRPVVFLSSEPLEIDPNPNEVAAAYRIPFGDLDRPDMPTLRYIPESDHPVLSVPILGGLVHSPTAAMIYQFFELAFRGRVVRVAHYEQPVFAWK